MNSYANMFLSSWGNFVGFCWGWGRGLYVSCHFKFFWRIGTFLSLVTELKIDTFMWQHLVHLSTTQTQTHLAFFAILLDISERVLVHISRRPSQHIFVIGLEVLCISSKFNIQMPSSSRCFGFLGRIS